MGIPGRSRPNDPRGSGGTLIDDSIQRLRDEIDAIDAQVVALLQSRARAAQRIGEAKADGARPTYVPARERQVIEHVQQLASDGPLTAGHVSTIFREIISACRSVERPLRVGYFGPAATFTHQAAIERFGAETDLVAIDTIAEVFADTEHGRLDFGVVPVENSTEGPVHPTLDSLVEHEVRVCSEIVLPISMQLMARVPREEIQTLYSIPIALAQCRGWVARNLPGRAIVDVSSTARAAMMAAEDPTGAAIGPRLAADQYGLSVVDQDIQDLASNYTRFYVIAAAAAGEPSGRDKTAIVFSIRDRVGALRDAADVFARRGINMSSIQSRPSRQRAWNYVFFIELAGHEGDGVLTEALEELRSQCVFLRVLGSWPVEPSA